MIIERIKPSADTTKLSTDQADCPHEQQKMGMDFQQKNIGYAMVFLQSRDIKNPPSAMQGGQGEMGLWVRPEEMIYGSSCG